MYELHCERVQFVVEFENTLPTACMNFIVRECSLSLNLKTHYLLHAWTSLLESAVCRWIWKHTTYCMHELHRERALPLPCCRWRSWWPSTPSRLASRCWRAGCRTSSGTLCWRWTRPWRRSTACGEKCCSSASTSPSSPSCGVTKQRLGGRSGSRLWDSRGRSLTVKSCGVIVQCSDVL